MMSWFLSQCILDVSGSKSVAYHFLFGSSSSVPCERRIKARNAVSVGYSCTFVLNRKMILLCILGVIDCEVLIVLRLLWTVQNSHRGPTMLT